MLKIWQVISVSFVIVLALAACSSGSATPTVTPTLPPTATLAPVEPTVTPEPQVQLAGPTNGSTLLWQDGSKLAYVPAGDFVMGSNGEDNPAHTVTLSSYWIQQTEVTNYMYQLCVSAGFCTLPLEQGAADAVFDSLSSQRPVLGVTWDQSQAYCQWAGGDLPTEAQWEKAARGPDGGQYPWGDVAPNCNLANFSGCLDFSARVGSYVAGASPYQVLDMAGNAYEWTRDWYDPGYYSQSPTQDPTGPQGGAQRVMRGGSFMSPADGLDVTLRTPMLPDQTQADLGFRCVVQTPTYAAPYCRMSAYNPGQPGSVLPPSSACVTPVIELKGRFCEQQKGFASFDSSQPIQSVESDILECTLVNDTRVHCGGPHSSTGQVTVCSKGCENQQITASPQLGCLAGYLSPQDNPSICEYGPVTLDTSGCPAGYECASPVDQNGTCPPGMYFDLGANTCVSVGQPSTQCLPGYTYNPQSQCCQAQVSDQYPGCPTGQYYDTLAGCQPMPGQTSQPGCVTFSLDTAVCREEEFSCDQIGNHLKCNQTSGCRWVGDPSGQTDGHCGPIQ
jgi:formylglycine-generating enzyme required for sulfatase activity